MTHTHSTVPLFVYTDQLLCQ